MTIIKRSQLAVLSITLMLAIAGYVNYKYNPDREKNLGQTVYVNGKDNFGYENVSIYDDNNTKETISKSEDSINSKTTENSIAVFKYDRDNMFSELSENYREIISNTNTDKTKINEYQSKLDELISRKNLITMVENVIKSKGIKDIVIIPTNNDKLNIVVKANDELKAEDVAKIQQLIQDQFGIGADKITISSVKE